MSTKAHFSEEMWKEDYYDRIRDKKSCRPKIVEKPEMLPVRAKEDIGPLYNLTYDSPISWEQFKPLPEDMKKKYLTHIREKFPGVAKSAIAQMMGVSHAVINEEVKNLGLNDIYKGWNKDSTVAFYNHYNLTHYDASEVKKKKDDIKIIKEKLKEKRQQNKNLKEEIKSLKDQIKNNEKNSKFDLDIISSFSFTADASVVSTILKKLGIGDGVTVKITVERDK